MSHDKGEGQDVEVEDQVPTLKTDPKVLQQMDKLLLHFESEYRVQPEFFVKVPGRVNLIGEHVDYCGYAVCPMAIEQHILMAVGTTQDRKIHLTNVNPTYKNFECNIEDVSECISEAEIGPAWHKYFLCGVKGALEMLPGERLPTGIQAAVWGDIPPNSGLSSSSALVSAALLSTVHASQFQLSKRDLATISAKAERHIGTQGGGMDQAIAFLGQAGSAKLIEFNPLRATDVTLPENAVFVIAHSRACHNKASTGDFNLRVAECRLAAQIIAKKRNKDWERVQKLIDVQEQLGTSLEGMVEIVMTELHEEPYTFDEICQSLGVTHERLKGTTLTASFSAWQTFKLRQRALHVFQEAGRVTAFRRISENREMPEDERIRQLGSLMSKSHASLQNLYECSHPKVDALVVKAMSCGALGARLTGAGWGGCIVAITTKDKVTKFVNALSEYLRQEPKSDSLQLEDLVFPTAPNQGALIYTN